MGGITARLAAILRNARARSGFLDHLVRALLRYKGDNGSRLATLITLPGFFSFFPLLALALSIAGYVSHYDHHAEEQITKAISSFFPGLVGSGSGQIDPAKLANNRGSTGIIGLVGLLFGGLGWIEAMRTSLRLMWHQPPLKANFLVRRVKDIGVLAAIGLAIIISFALTTAATAASHEIVSHTPLPNGGITKVLLQIAAIAIAVAGDVVLFAVLFLRLPAVDGQFDNVATGALFGAIGFEVLKSVGAIYIQHTTSNPLYASFSIVIGLLVWTGLTCQVFMLSAAWAVTGAYASDLLPSGTSVDVATDAGVGVAAVPSTLAPSGSPQSPTAPPRRGAEAGPGVAAGRAAGAAALAGIGVIGAVVVRSGVRTARGAFAGRR